MGDVKPGKGKSKGKGKGKGKGKRSAPLKSNFWEKKLESENREVVNTKTYNGTISRYNMKGGYGFISPDNYNGLPKKVKESLAAAAATAAEAGKEQEDTTLLYFRKPDVNHQEGFKLAADTPVTFTVYVDEKGAGACDVSPA